MPIIEDYIKRYPSKKTQSTYKTALRNFLESLFGTRDFSAAEDYFNPNRDYEADLETYFQHISGKPPLTIRTFLAAVKGFLEHNDVELKQKYWKGLTRRIQGKRARTRDRIPSNKELRQILSFMDAKGRALFLLLSSSGMRIGEALKLEIADIDTYSNPAKIEIRGETTKSGDPRYTFISSEANEALKLWLKIKSKYVKTAVGRSHLNPKSETDERIFPFELSVAYSMWNNALDNLGLGGRDSSTNRRKLHPHVLRKYFRTRMGTILRQDVVEALMGHEGYLTEVYRRYNVEDLAKFYLQGESALLVFTEAAEVTRLRQEVDERNKALHSLVNGLTAENLDMKSKIAKVELENTDLRKRFRNLEDAHEEVVKRNESLKPLTEFMNSFKSREELQSFLDSFKSASVIRFPEHKLRLIMEKLGGGEDRWVMISEIFQDMWEKMTEQTLDLVLKHLEKEDSR